MSLILYRIFSFKYFNFNVLPPKLCAYLARTSIENSIRSNTLLMFPTYFRLLYTSLSTALFHEATIVVQTASPVMLTAVRVISRIRSIPMISAIPSIGSPTELNTIVSVISPTLGTPAVPMEASVAVPMTVR